ncbi:MAG: ferrous iron transport protein B [Eubacteriales bacterium]|nr:ferrous iron transport protein B [Eubacteriales bacterium]
MALAGNPNVGKSTVFNALTGLKQHTGNWPGKTVQNARGYFFHAGKEHVLFDLPGTYSLLANSAEEEIARDFICFSRPDVTVVVADATCLERSLNLVLQVREITKNTVLCVNLMDEAKKKGISVDLTRLGARLSLRAVGASARSGAGIQALLGAVAAAGEGGAGGEGATPLIDYGPELEQAVSLVEPAVTQRLGGRLDGRWAALRLLEGNESLLASLFHSLGFDLAADEQIAAALNRALAFLEESGIARDALRDRITAARVFFAESVAREVLTEANKTYRARDERIDKVLTSRLFGYPLMLLLLFFILWLTIAGANVPSALLSDALFSLMGPAKALLSAIRAPEPLIDLLVNGVYKTLAWVVSVMLPPMAIFFPLFTILEDWGYLPRVAFNLDGPFRRAGAHGKQALTTCMGFGCNACGVTGCRIIDSPRERLVAVLTNSFVPCNGRFPLLILLSTLFFAGAGGGPVPALMLTGFLVLGVSATLLSAKLLSKTLLRGVPSSFQLELPPYRLPQFGKVLVRSLLDRTIFVLGRAVGAAAPAGLLIWLLAAIKPEGVSLLIRLADFFNPFARLMGMDGYILLAFFLALPANEIVLPLILMGYTASASLSSFESMASLRALFLAHGWTNVTALCVMLFSLLHWPCATTLFTIKKETGSLKWTFVAFLLPTAWGIAVCMAVAALARVFG